MEKFFLRALLSSEELYIVNQQRAGRTIVLLEVVDSTVTQCYILKKSQSIA